MDKLRSNTWLLLTAIFAVCLTVFTLSYMVTEPWHIIPELGGDGIKNIFTFLYHSMYGKGYWFDGMNYPYGEHIVYTDGQPVLSVLLTCFKHVTVGEALTVLWLLIGLSYVLSILYIYKILVHFQVAPFAAMLFAGLIGIFTPQIIRLQGHYALSYTCVIPMLFYWTIKYQERMYWRYCVYFFLTGCITAFIHPYYAAMILIWTLSYVAGYFIFTKDGFYQKAKHVLPLLMSVLLVLGVVAVVMKITDPVTDRPVTPFNTLYETCTRIKQIITSFISPVWQPLLKTHLYHYISDGGEGYAYIGVVTALTAGICFLIGALKSFRQKRLTIIIESTGFSPIWLFMAFAVLLFSMGVPFIWHMEWLMNYLAIFKQFRSLGRFSWIFYYIISIYTAIVIYRYYAQLVAGRKFFAGYALLILAMGLWGYEASGYIKYARNLSRGGLYNYDMMFSTHEQNWPSFLEAHHFKNNDFQALLLLPFFHIGTEKLWVGYGNWLITLGSKAALQLHLPIIDVMMSRSSWGEAEKQVKIAAGKYVDKPILHDIKSDKPFLLLRIDGDSLDEDQRYLLEAADYIGHYSQCYVYACYPQRIAANDKKNADSVNRILPFMHQEDTIIANNGTCYIEHYDTKSTTEHLFGRGAATAIPGDSAVIAAIPVASPEDSQLYELSCWLLLSDKDPRGANISVQLINEQGKVDTTADLLTRQSTDNYGMWFRSSRYFYVHKNIKAIRCMVMNTPNPSYIALDELLLRPAGALVISKAADGSVMVDNHLFKIK